MNRAYAVVAVWALALTVSPSLGGEVHEAAAVGDVERLEALLKADPEAVNARDQYKRTPLYLAVMNKPRGLRMVEVLLDHGAAVDGASIVGTPLHAAVNRRRLDVVRLLLRHGADPNRRNHHGESALGLATLQCDAGIEIVEALLDHGGKPDGPMLRRAVSFNAPRVVRALIKHGADPNAGRGGAWNPVRLAVDRRDEPMLRLLLDLKADVNVRARDGRTVLHDVPQYGKEAPEWVDLLVSLGADVNAKDRFGVTPLDFAVGSRRVETVKRLLKHKADPNSLRAVRDVRKPGEREADHQIVELLVKHGANAGVRDESGMTPLWYLAWRGRRDVVEVILASGAKADLFTLLELGRSAEARKAIAARPEVVRDRYYTGETPLHVAVRRGLDDVVALCLARDADPNARDTRGYTPLHLAARFGRLAAVKRLIAAGADVNARSSPGWHYIGGIDRLHNGRWAPLHLAAQGGHVEVVGLLLRHKADVNARDAFGCTALHWAVARGDVAVVRLLLSHKPRLNDGCQGASREIKLPHESRWRRLTPLKIARLRKREEIARLLIRHGAKEEADGVPIPPSGPFGFPTTKPSPPDALPRTRRTPR